VKLTVPALARAAGGDTCPRGAYHRPGWQSRHRLRREVGGPLKKATRCRSKEEARSHGWLSEIAAITGHSLRDVRSILDAHYLHRDPELARHAIHKLAMDYARRSQRRPTIPRMTPKWSDQLVGESGFEPRLTGQSQLQDIDSI
jgi:hypothetical protein